MVVLQVHYQNILSENADRQLHALNAINVLETGMSNAEPEPLESCAELTAGDLDSDIFNRAKIYLHYWVNEKFINFGY